MSRVWRMRGDLFIDNSEYLVYLPIVEILLNISYIDVIFSLFLYNEREEEQ